MELTVTFNQPVAVTGNPQFIVPTIHRSHLDILPTLRTPRYRTFNYNAARRGMNKVVFTYTALSRDEDRHFWSPSGNGMWQLNSGGAITDSWRAAGSRLSFYRTINEGRLTKHQYSRVPRVKTVEITFTPTEGTNSDTYGNGDEIEVTGTINHDVTVTGDPEFKIALVVNQCWIEG